MQFSRQIIYNKKLGSEANEIFINDNDKQFEQNGIDLFSKFIQIIS